MSYILKLILKLFGKTRHPLCPICSAVGIIFHYQINNYIILELVYGIQLIYF